MVGDTYVKFDTVASGNYLECKPVAGSEVVIHNIYHPGDVTLKLVDGSGNELTFFAEAGQSFLTNIFLHITAGQYLRIYNASGGPLFLAADGIYTKSV